MTTLHNLLFKITLGEIDRWISENGTDSGTSQGYKFREADKLEKFLHVMENMSISFPVEDFDVLNGTEGEHRERFEKVNTEVLLTMLVNMLIHLLMLAPLWYTGNQEN